MKKALKEIKPGYGLGNLKFGMTRAAVKLMLGEPSFIDKYSHSDSAEDVPKIAAFAASWMQRSIAMQRAMRSPFSPVRLEGFLKLLHNFLTKLSQRELEILKMVFVGSDFFSKMVMTPDDKRTVFQNELSVLFDKLDRLVD